MEKRVQVPHQLGSIINDMDECLKAGLFYPALLIALTLPEVCVALNLTSDVFVKEKHYVGFINTYCQDLGLDGLSCYRLRGGVVHRGNAAGHPFFGETHVVFTTPNSAGSLQGFSISDEASGTSAAMFDLAWFCSCIRNGVLDWYVDHKDDPLVRTNMPALLSLRPNGIHPWVTGTPVIASGLAG